MVILFKANPNKETIKQNECGRTSKQKYPKHTFIFTIITKFETDKTEQIA